MKNCQTDLFRLNKKIGIVGIKDNKPFIEFLKGLDMMEIPYIFEEAYHQGECFFYNGLVRKWIGYRTPSFDSPLSQEVAAKHNLTQDPIIHFFRRGAFWCQDSFTCTPIDVV